jgi:hypothetical protein
LGTVSLDIVSLDIISLDTVSLGTRSGNAASLLVATEVKHTKQSKSQNILGRINTA